MIPAPTRRRPGVNRVGVVAVGIAVTAAVAVGSAGRASTPPTLTTPPSTVARTIAPDPPPGPPVVTGSQPVEVLPLPDESPSVTITTVRCSESVDIGGFVSATVTNPSDGGPPRRYRITTTNAGGEVTLPDGQDSTFSVGRVAVGDHTMTVSDVNTGATVEVGYTIEPCAESTTSTSPTTTATTGPDDPVATDTVASDTAEPGAAPGGSNDVSTPAGPAVVGHAQVIAHGAVAFPAGSFRWDHQPIGADGWALTYDGSPPMLLAADGPDPLLVVADGTSQALLHAGEALFVAAGSTGAASPLFDGAVTVGHRITFVAAGGPGSFTPGDGRRDVDLVRDVLAPGETFTASSAFPILVVVTEGSVIDTASDSALPGGIAATLGSDVELRNTGDRPAVILAALVGDPVP